MATELDTAPMPRIVDCWLCGEPVAAGSESCPHCGAPPPERRQREQRHKSRGGAERMQEEARKAVERERAREKLRRAVANARRSGDYSGLPAAIINQLADEVVLSTETDPVGMPVLRRIGMLVSEQVFGAGILRERNFGAVSDSASERVTSIEDTITEARDDCLRDLRRQALRKGADAVIAVSLAYTAIAGRSDGMMLVTATGTAVSTTLRETDE